MQRHTWEFEYKASEVLSAARAKMIHHKSRQTWWEKKQAQVVSGAKKSGLSIDESLATSYSTSNAGHGARLVVDNRIQEKLSECHQKIEQHHGQKQEYAGWVEVLKSRKESLKLNADDYLYFFGS